MRIAVCYSGQIRAGLRCIENQRSFFDGLNVDVFLHTWTTNTDKRRNKKVTCISPPSIKRYVEALDPKSFEIEDARSLYLDAHERGPEAQVYSWRKSVVLKQRYEQVNGFKYDYVFKLRPDIIMHPSRRMSYVIDQIRSREFIVDSYCPNTQTINDVWFAASNNIMDLAASNPISNIISDLGISLVNNDIQPRCVDWKQFAPYAILRDDCPFDADNFDACRQFDNDIYNAPMVIQCE